MNRENTKANGQTRRVVVAFRLAGVPGRRKLEGFLRYVNEHRLDTLIPISSG